MRTLKILLLCLLLLAQKYVFSQCADTVYFTPIVVSYTGDSVEVGIAVKDFNDIASAQFTLLYDPGVLEAPEFVQTTPLVTNISFNLREKGQVRFAWTDFAAMGVTFEDGTLIYSLKFKLLSNASTTLRFSSSPILIEVTDNDLNDLCVNTSSVVINEDLGIIEGKIIVNDDNCSSLSDPPPYHPVLQLSSNEKTYYRKAEQDGSYRIYVPEGDYTFEAVHPNDIWSNCDDVPTISIVKDETLTQDIAVAINKVCPALSVNLSTPFLRRCFDNRLLIQYENNGSAMATNTRINLTLDPFFEYLDTDVEDVDVSGQELTISVGDVAPGTSGKVVVLFNLNCDDTVLGMTHCSEVTITSDTDCALDFSGYDVEVKADCEGDSVRFEIENIGDGPMTEDKSYIVIEDEVFMMDNSFQLDAGEKQTVKFKARGTTLRMTAEDNDSHPFDAYATAAIEGCGEGQLSLGFYTQFGEDDFEPNHAKLCEENIGSFDPNDKLALPRGVGTEQLISGDDAIHYKIRFQNTGTDTAFNVRLEDVISPHLDLSSLQLGPASHDFTYEILDERKLIIYFDNIKLVDSTTNEPFSHGFIALTLSQNNDNLPGTTIENEANIFFDFNDPILTNLVTHKVEETVFNLVSSDVDIISRPLEIYPNPSAGIITVYTEEANALLQIFAMDGKLVQQQNLRFAARNTLDVNALDSGFYLVRVVNADKQLLYHGKLIRR